ncbi:MAG TPA: NAD-dependent epimerase/dehydratase family protein [Kofleriaceae bacterium]|nr:NAD-dependent epimerase/dehydratase family protein [Kofleriaceae bacterium]
MADDEPAPRALVIGASGHVGNAVVRELLARGHAVTAARRGRTAAANLAGLAVAEAIGDAEHAGTLDRWVAGHELVVDAAAPYAMTITERAVIAAAARRAQLVIDAIDRHRARLIHIGSFVTRLGTDDAGRPREPGQRLDSVAHPYFAAKRVGEAVLVAAARAGAPITIMQPTTCLGPWDSRPPRMSLVPRVLLGLQPVAPSHVINVVDVRDVARAAVAAAHRGYHGEPLLVTGHNVGIPELCGLIAELGGLGGRAARTRGVPAGIARAMSWALELAAPGAYLPPPLLSTLLALRQAPLAVSAAQRALGAAPRPLSATLRDAISWHRERGVANDGHARRSSRAL